VPAPSDAGCIANITITAAFIHQLVVLAADVSRGVSDPIILLARKSRWHKRHSPRSKWEADVLSNSGCPDGGFYFLSTRKSANRNRCPAGQCDPPFVFSKTPLPRAAFLPPRSMALLTPSIPIPGRRLRLPCLLKKRLGFLESAIAKYARMDPTEKSPINGDYFQTMMKMAWALVTLSLATGY